MREIAMCEALTNYYSVLDLFNDSGDLIFKTTLNDSFISLTGLKFNSLILLSDGSTTFKASSTIFLFSIVLQVWDNMRIG